MKALRKLRKGYDQMELTNVPTPIPNGHKILIKVMFSSICGSDLHGFHGDYTRVTPLTLGHEFSGIVEAVGSDVNGFQKGDRVVSETTFETCASCSYCKEKDYNLCSSRRGIGTQVDGSFADYVLANSHHCHQIPNKISFEEAALVEPLACCVHAVLEKTSPEAKEIVLVFGPGPIGIMVSLVLLAKNANVYLVGTSKDQTRLDFASGMGINTIVTTSADSATSDILNATGNLEPTKIFECSGSKEALATAMDVVRKKGIIIQEGLFKGEFTPVWTEKLLHKELVYIGSRTQKPSSWKIALELLETGAVDLKPLITKTLALANWREAFDDLMQKRAIKILLKP